MLLMAGEHDELTPPAEVQAVAEAIDGARFVLIPGAGHMSPMENPRAFNEAILEFLEQCSGC